MANWQYRLDLKDLWKKRNEGDISIQEMGKEIAKRIRKLPCYKEYEDDLEEIATNFEYIDEDVEEFDYFLEQLYDWADISLSSPKGTPFCMQRKLCWVATF